MIVMCRFNIICGFEGSIMPFIYIIMLVCVCFTLPYICSMIVNFTSSMCLLLQNMM